MSDTADRYRRLSTDFTRTLHGVPADDWDRPTPCAGWTTRELVSHVVGSQSQFLGFVGIEPDPRPEVDSDPVGAWTVVRDQLQAALDDPAAAQQEFDGYAGRTTLEQSVGRFICMDLVVHRWDLARATGQDERLAPADVAWVHELAASFGDMLRMDGVCGPEVEVPADADPQSRMLAYLGRQP